MIKKMQFRPADAVLYEVYAREDGFDRAVYKIERYTPPEC